MILEKYNGSTVAAYFLDGTCYSKTYCNPGCLYLKVVLYLEIQCSTMVLKIVTNMVTNATNISSLVAKNSDLVTIIMTTFDEK